MEINPDELYSMITNETECETSELIELVDTYLCTTTEMVIEAVYQHTQSCLDKNVCQRICSSLLKQLEEIKETEFISELGKTYLDEIKSHVDLH